MIAKHFSGLTGQGGVALGIGDDAALINTSPNQQLVVASDTLVEGVHFPSTASGKQIATRALCVNLSDMAAMGAQPRWFTLALTLPKKKANSLWLADFSAGIAEIAQQFDIALVGGDTTSGPLTVSITMLGEAPAGKSLQRAGAGVGDTVFVTGTLGDGAAGLKSISSINSINSDSERLLHRFYAPRPQVEIGLRLRGIASACIDISDGLIADLGHICQSSGVAASIYQEQLPVAADVKKLAPDHFINWALFGGDDYQLCFTVGADKLATVEQWISRAELDASKIGIIQASSDSNNLVTVLDQDNNPIAINKQGYDHFG
ncbi:MAG: thiamine-phosphate kinase [Porticoccaceae bacterium]|nr:thiamine-phosphate kinase [Porticoccaceae bacterium]